MQLQPSFKRLVLATSVALGLLPGAALAEDAVETSSGNTKKSLNVSSNNAVNGNAQQAFQHIQASQGNLYNGYATLSGFYGEANDGSNGSLDLFIPVAQNLHNLFFADIRGTKRSGSGGDVSLGAGYRGMNADQWLMWGGRAYYEVLNSGQNNTFNQVTVGAELKTEHWELEGNGYIPVGDTMQRVQSWDNQQLRAGTGGYQNIWYITGEEVAMSGFSGTLGYSIHGFEAITLYAGGFSYSGTDVESISGPLGRITWDIDNPFYFEDPMWKSIFQRLTFEGDVRYDDVRGTDWFVGLRLRLGFGDNSHLTGLQKRMLDYIHTGSGLVSSRNTQTNYQRYNKADGTPYNVSIVSTVDELNAASGADIIGVNGTLNGVNTSVTLSNNQTITGGGYTFLGDHTIQLGTNGTLVKNGGTATDPLLIVGKNNTIENLTLTTPSREAPVIKNSAQNTSFGNLVIDHVTTNNGPVNLTVSDGSSDSVLTFTHNHMVSDNIGVSDASLLSVQVNNSIGDTAINIADISHNIFDMQFDTSLFTAGSAVYLYNNANSMFHQSTLTVNTITNNVFNMNADEAVSTVGHKAIFINTYATASSVAHTYVQSIKNNNISFLASDLPTGIYINNAVVGSGTIETTVDEISNNQIHFSDDLLNGTGIYLHNQLALENSSSVGSIKFNVTGGVNNNTITGGTTGLYVRNYTGSGTTNLLSTMNIAAINGNHITFNTYNAGNVGLQFEATDNSGIAGANDITVNSLKSNQIDFIAPLGQSVIGIDLDVDGDPRSASTIHVNVNDGDNGLSLANNGTLVTHDDSDRITVVPGF